MDPLVEAVWHNQAVSNLPRLPDKVLKLVIQNLDNCGLECFRRVSRRFTALCDDEVSSRPNTFQPVWGAPGEYKDAGGPFAWPRFRIFNGSWKESSAQERQRLIDLQSRDWYCEGCHAAREAPDWDQRVKQLTKYLYCQACKAEHPACLFSVQQRQSPTRRRCIAHEGYIRLCQHDEGVVRWAKISRIRQRLEEGVEDKRQYEIRCMDSSHVTPCAHTGTTRSGQVTFRPGCGDVRCIEYPSPKLWVAGSKIWLAWAAHSPVSRPLTAADLRPRVMKIREKGGRFLCPAITPHPKEDVPEMSCFDPNDCDCVLFEGQGNINMQFDSAQYPERVCRLNPSKRLYPDLGSSRMWSTNSLVDGTRRLLCKLGLDMRSECRMPSKIHRTRLEFNLRGVAGESSVKCWPCHAGDKCLVFEYARRIRIGEEEHIGVEWYQALDTESYDLTGDEAGFEVYWCRQKQCRNYHRRVPGFSRIVRGAEWQRPGSEYQALPRITSEEEYWSSVMN